MAKFVLFAKRRDISEANLRIFCMTDDKEERTLEEQEHYSQVAKSRDVEVIEGQTLYLEFGGNLVPTYLSPGGGRGSRQAATSSAALLNEQLCMDFRAFEENRLAFVVRLKEVGQEPSGRIAFMEDSMRYLASLNAQQRAYMSEKRRRAVCTLRVSLPPMCVNYDNILGTPKRNSYLATARVGDLSLADIANLLQTDNQQQQRGKETDSLQETNALSGEDWQELAPRLGIPRDEVEFIAEYCRANEIQSGQATSVSPALILLMHWYKLASPEWRDQDLARALVTIGRDDIAKRLNFAIEPKRISRSTMELLHEIELIPVRSAENLYTGSELSGYGAGLGFGAGSRGTSLRRLTENPSQQQQQQQQAAALRSSSRSSSERPRLQSASGRYINQSSRTEIGVPPGENLEARVRTREQEVPSIRVESESRAESLVPEISMAKPAIEQLPSPTTTTITSNAPATSGDTSNRSAVASQDESRRREEPAAGEGEASWATRSEKQPDLAAESASSRDQAEMVCLQFAESLVEQIFKEACEAYQRQASQTPSAPASVASANPVNANAQSSAQASSSDRASSRRPEWTEDKNGTLSHMVEQTTFVDTNKQRGSLDSGKKQRRRKSGAAVVGGTNVQDKSEQLSEELPESGKLASHELGQAQQQQTESRTRAGSKESSEEPQLYQLLARKIQTEPSADSSTLAHHADVTTRLNAVAPPSQPLRPLEAPKAATGGDWGAIEAPIVATKPDGLQKQRQQVATLDNINTSTITYAESSASCEAAAAAAGKALDDSARAPTSASPSGQNSKRKTPIRRGENNSRLESGKAASSQLGSSSCGQFCATVAGAGANSSNPDLDSLGGAIETGGSSHDCELLAAHLAAEPGKRQAAKEVETAKEEEQQQQLLQWRQLQLAIQAEQASSLAAKEGPPADRPQQASSGRATPSSLPDTDSGDFSAASTVIMVAPAQRSRLREGGEEKAGEEERLGDAASAASTAFESSADLDSWRRKPHFERQADRWGCESTECAPAERPKFKAARVDDGADDWDCADSPGRADKADTDTDNEQEGTQTATLHQQRLLRAGQAANEPTRTRAQTRSETQLARARQPAPANQGNIQGETGRDTGASDHENDLESLVALAATSKKQSGAADIELPTGKHDDDDYDGQAPNAESIRAAEDTESTEATRSLAPKLQQQPAPAESARKRELSWAASEHSPTDIGSASGGNTRGELTGKARDQRGTSSQQAADRSWAVGSGGGSIAQRSEKCPAQAAPASFSAARTRQNSGRLRQPERPRQQKRHLTRSEHRERRQSSLSAQSLPSQSESSQTQSDAHLAKVELAEAAGPFRETSARPENRGSVDLRAQEALASSRVAPDRVGQQAKLGQLCAVQVGESLGTERQLEESSEHKGSVARDSSPSSRCGQLTNLQLKPNESAQHQRQAQDKQEARSSELLSTSNSREQVCVVATEDQASFKVNINDNTGLSSAAESVGSSAEQSPAISPISRSPSTTTPTTTPTSSSSREQRKARLKPTSSSASASSQYVTAPLAGELVRENSLSAASNIEETGGSTSCVSIFETARSNLTDEAVDAQLSSSSTVASSRSDSSATTADLPAQGQAGAEAGAMVSFSTLEQHRPPAVGAPSAGSPTMGGAGEQLGADLDASGGPRFASKSPSSPEMPMQGAGDDDEMMNSPGSPDEEQMRRLLTSSRRLSEGCANIGGRQFNSSCFVQRKNSLHMIEELPALTEGEPMKHHRVTYPMSSQQDLGAAGSGSASSTSSGSLRGLLAAASRPGLLRELAMKRNSQDDNATTSCSSSTSLERSPTRRRSSTVSQCSSVLSEGTRNQLNFDLSPDLAPDSSLLEANAISPIDMDRPASPEPPSSSLSGDAFDQRQHHLMRCRPESRMSACLPTGSGAHRMMLDDDDDDDDDDDEATRQHQPMVLAPPSPDSTLGDSNDQDGVSACGSAAGRGHQQVGVAALDERLERVTQSYGQLIGAATDTNSSCSFSNDQSETMLLGLGRAGDRKQQESALGESSQDAESVAATDSSNLEQLIAEVSEVVVLSGCESSSSSSAQSSASHNRHAQQQVPKQSSIQDNKGEILIGRRETKTTNENRFFRLSSQSPPCLKPSQSSSGSQIPRRRLPEAANTAKAATASCQAAKRLADSPEPTTDHDPHQYLSAGKSESRKRTNRLTISEAPQPTVDVETTAAAAALLGSGAPVGMAANSPCTRGRGRHLDPGNRFAGISSQPSTPPRSSSSFALTNLQNRRAKLNFSLSPSPSPPLDQRGWQQHGASSTCSSSSSSAASSSFHIVSASSTAAKHGGVRDQRIDDEVRVLHLIKMERKDCQSSSRRLGPEGDPQLSASRRRPTSAGAGGAATAATTAPSSVSIGSLSGARSSSSRQKSQAAAVVGHRHSGKDSEPFCYCHNY